MDIQETLSKIQIGFSDPSVSQERFDELQRDKAVVTERIVEEIKRLGVKHSVPSTDMEDVAQEIVSAIDTMTIPLEQEYREEIGCRLDCLQSRDRRDS